MSAFQSASLLKSPLPCPSRVLDNGFVFGIAFTGITLWGGTALASGGAGLNVAAFGLDEDAGGDLAGTAFAGGPDRDKLGGAPMFLGGPAAFEAIARNLLSFIGPGNDFNAPSSSAGSTCAMTLRSSMGT